MIGQKFIYFHSLLALKNTYLLNLIHSETYLLLSLSLKIYIDFLFQHSFIHLLILKFIYSFFILFSNSQIYLFFQTICSLLFSLVYSIICLLCVKECVILQFQHLFCTQSAFEQFSWRGLYKFWLIDWLTDWPIHWLIGWLTDWLIDWLTDCLFDWLIDWLVDYSHIYFWIASYCNAHYNRQRYLCDVEVKCVLKVLRLSDDHQVETPTAAEIGDYDGVDRHRCEERFPRRLQRLSMETIQH